MVVASETCGSASSRKLPERGRVPGEVHGISEAL
jgi:hypothetical protein